MENKKRNPFVVYFHRPSCCNASSSGSDKTNTLNDFYDFYDWVNNEEKLQSFEFTGKSKLRGKLKNRPSELDKSEFGSMITTAFQHSFLPIRNAFQPEGIQSVIWYYAGHGVDQTICDQHYLGMPLLDQIEGYDGSRIYARSDYICDRIKGGELFLHHVGFCNLRSLIQSWIVTVEADSSNAPGQKKKNKHLVIILDSCYSGVLAEDLKNMKRDPIGPLNTALKNCSVTVQASCQADESVDGGYFTPVFLHLNKEENQSLLEELEEKWRSFTDDQKDAYNNLCAGSSPMISTTTNLPYHHLLKIPLSESFTLNLFPDARFFKFCYQMVSVVIPDGEPRLLSHPGTAKEFLQKSGGEFDVVDYKLKMDSQDPPKPLGLFLLNDTKNPRSKYRFCAHIHFSHDNPNDVECINLVHHRKTTRCSIEFDEDLRKDLGRTGNITVYLINGEKTTHAIAMVKACRDYVRHTGAHDWDKVSDWDME